MKAFDDGRLLVECAEGLGRKLDQKGWWDKSGAPGSTIIAPPGQPPIKSIEYFENGLIKRIEYWEPKTTGRSE